MLRTRKHLRTPRTSEDSYELSTSPKCREQIHTSTVFVFATVLLAYSMGTAANFAAWLVGTTKLFLGLPMFLTRYYSHEEHQTQWPTRLLSGAFDALFCVGNVTIGALCGHYSGSSAGAAAGFCLSWYAHGAVMRKLGFIEKRADGTWTDFGPILQELCFLWDVIVRPAREGHDAVKQPFTGPTLAMFAYNIVRRGAVPGALLVLRAEPDGPERQAKDPTRRGAREDGPPALRRVLPDERLRQVEPGLPAEGPAEDLVRLRGRAARSRAVPSSHACYVMAKAPRAAPS